MAACRPWCCSTSKTKTWRNGRACPPGPGPSAPHEHGEAPDGGKRPALLPPEAGRGPGQCPEKLFRPSPYLLSGTSSDGKVKAELGDDPDRTGAYQFSFSIYNLSQEAKTYAFGSDVLTRVGGNHRRCGLYG